MADLHKIQRSRDMLSEVYNSLLDRAAEDESLRSHIHVLKRSIRVMDHKIKKYKSKQADTNAGNSLSQEDRSLAA